MEKAESANRQPHRTPLQVLRKWAERSWLWDATPRQTLPGCFWALSVTVNGLGERAGNAALEEVAMAIVLSGENTCRIRPADLMPLCTLVSQASQRPIPPNKPITGALVFTHESGIHCNGMLRDPRTYEPFSGSLLGRRSEFVVGKHSGKALLRHGLYQPDISTSTLHS